MFKFFRRKLNKKGFTLAEMLIVVAIIAILVAIAIPIFTGALDEAQIGVNRANARSIKGAATMEILADWEKMQAGASNAEALTGRTAYGSGWLASAQVNAKGDIVDINVYVAFHNQPDLTDAVVYRTDANNPGPDPLAEHATSGTANMAENFTVTAGADGASPQYIPNSGSLKPAYWIVVQIKDVEKIGAGEGTKTP